MSIVLSQILEAKIHERLEHYTLRERSMNY